MIENLILQFKGLRKERKISQVQVSELSGVPQKTISRMENGKAKPNLATMEKLYLAIGYKLKVEIEKI